MNIVIIVFYKSFLASGCKLDIINATATIDDVAHPTLDINSLGDGMTNTCLTEMPTNSRRMDITFQRSDCFNQTHVNISVSGMKMHCTDKEIVVMASVFDGTYGTVNVYINSVLWCHMKIVLMSLLENSDCKYIRMDKCVK